MKRGGLPKRRTALRGAKGLDRGKGLVRKAFPVKPGSLRVVRSDRERILADLFYEAVTTIPAPTSADPLRRLPANCLLCGAMHDLDPHHVLAKGWLFKVERTLRLERGVLAWDPSDGIPLCRWCHDRHEAGERRVPLVLLPEYVFGFASHVNAMLGTEAASVRLEQAYPA